MDTWHLGWILGFAFPKTCLLRLPHAVFAQGRGYSLHGLPLGFGPGMAVVLCHPEVVVSDHPST